MDLLVFIAVAVEIFVFACFALVILLGLINMLWGNSRKSTKKDRKKR